MLSFCATTRLETVTSPTIKQQTVFRTSMGSPLRTFDRRFCGKPGRKCGVPDQNARVQFAFPPAVRYPCNVSTCNKLALEHHLPAHDRGAHMGGADRVG